MRVVTININNRCPLRCRHCSIGFSQSNRGTGYRIDPAQLESIVRKIDPDLYDMVLLAGGEPSLEVELIQLAIATARANSLSSALVTAPIWAPTPARALKFAASVAGLDVLVLSYDDFHLEFLKDQHYRNAASAARMAGCAVTFQIVYTCEDDRCRLERAVHDMKQGAHVHASRAVGVGNAGDLGDEERARITMDSLEDLRSLPRSCVLGNALVDERLAVHGCCWAATAEQSRFTERGDDGLDAAFKRLESGPAFKAVNAHGFIDALADGAATELLERVRGRRFATECDLCLAAMAPGMEPVWERISRGVREGMPA